MVLLTAAIIFGGIRTISSVTEWLVPIMAVLYLLLGLLVVLLNITQIPNMLLMIFRGAFGIKEFVTGGTMGAVIWGMKRGLLINGASMGTARTPALPLLFLTRLSRATCEPWVFTLTR